MMKVVRLGDDEMTVSIDGKEVSMLRFRWKDGSESAYSESEDGAMRAYSTEKVQVK